MDIDREIAPTIIQPTLENQEKSTNGNCHLSILKKAADDARAAEATAQQNYQKMLFEVDVCERFLQIVQQYNLEQLIPKAVVRKTDCQNRVRYLKSLIERYSMLVSDIESRLASWES